jgi:small subunit ribosomal protein S21
MQKMLRLSQKYIEIRLQITVFCNNYQLRRSTHPFSNEPLMQTGKNMVLEKTRYTTLKNLQESYFPLDLQSQILKGGIIMLIIDSKDCENIDKALKKYKKKYEKSRTLNQLRERQSFTKPSVRRRTEILKAVYRRQMEIGAAEA